jgi:hypothetical protein
MRASDRNRRMDVQFLLVIATVLLTCSPALSETGSDATGGQVAAREGRISPGMVAEFIGFFSPEPSGPDYVLTFAPKEPGPLGHVPHTITRHGQWVRLDRRNGDANFPQHVHLPTATVVEYGPAPPGSLTYLTVRAPPQNRYGRIDHHSFRTGRFDTVLGESCEIWDVYRGVEAGVPTFTRFGCVTADGVELSHRTTSRSGEELGHATTAVSLVRRAVLSSEVEPRREILTLTPWLGPPTDITAGSGAQADFEVDLKSDDSHEALTIRRHFPWTFKDRRHLDGSRSFDSDRSDTGTRISARLGPAGQPENLAFIRDGEPSPPRSVQVARPPTSILGLSCTWFDMMPGAFDVHRQECRTSDGLVLSVVEGGRGSSRHFTAVSINRRPLTIADVLPPHELLDLKIWAVH